MSNKSKIISILIIIMLIAAATVYAAGPGSTEDPLVTKSYVDEQIRILINSGAGSGSGSSGGKALVVEELKKDQLLIAHAGTEFILRGGHAVAYGTGTDNIPDLTTGTGIKIGSAIPRDHLILFPRDDDRGFKITGSVPAYVMIRGSYEIR